MQILNQRQRQCALVSGIALDRLDGFQTGASMCAPAPFATDQLVAVGGASNDDRLQLPPTLDGFGELVERVVVKSTPGHTRIRPYFVNAQGQKPDARPSHP